MFSVRFRSPPRRLTLPLRLPSSTDAKPSSTGGDAREKGTPDAYALSRTSSALPFLPGLIRFASYRPTGRVKAQATSVPPAGGSFGDLDMSNVDSEEPEDEESDEYDDGSGESLKLRIRRPARRLTLTSIRSDLNQKPIILDSADEAPVKK